MGASVIMGSRSLPDHTDPETVLNFAKITYDSYYDYNDSKWIEIPGWNVVWLILNSLLDSDGKMDRYGGIFLKMNQEKI